MYALLLAKTGLALFVAGLLIGFAISRFHNARMALSAHLTAVQAGTFLLAIAAFWPVLSVPKSIEHFVAWSLVLSNCLLVAGLLLSAATGASRVLPIAGAGFRGSRAKERLVSAMVLGSSVWMLLATAVILGFFLTPG